MGKSVQLRPRKLASTQIGDQKCEGIGQERLIGIPSKSKYEITEVEPRQPFRFIKKVRSEVNDRINQGHRPWE